MTASARPAWKTATARDISRHGAASFCHGWECRRRQVHPHRAVALRLEGDLRGSVRVGRAHQPGAGRRLHRPGAVDRRPAGRAGAGHHHRCRLPLFRHPPPQVHHRRHPWPHPVHAEHGHRGLDRRPRPGAGRRPQGRPRAVAPARLPGLAAGYPPPGGVRQQDGPGRLVAAALRRDQGRVPQLCHEARRPRPHVRAHLGVARRQRGRAVRQHAVVRGPLPAAPARRGAHRQRPQPHRRPLPGPVRHPPPGPDQPRPARLPRLRGHGRRRGVQAGRRGGRSARPA